MKKLKFHRMIEKLIEEIITNKVEGKILWINSNDDSSFNSQSINIDLQDCSFFKIIYKLNKNGEECVVSEIPFFNLKIRTKNVVFSQVAQKDVAIARNCIVETDGKVTFSSCTSYGLRNDAYVNTEQNDMMIPLRIVGYKYFWNKN